MKTFSFSAAVLACALTLTILADPAEARRNWPQWRGPLASGVAPEADPPLEWSESKNVKWKIAVPGIGSSTPTVWGNHVFVLTAIGVPKPAQPKSADDSYQFMVLCLDRGTGNIL